MGEVENKKIKKLKNETTNQSNESDLSTDLGQQHSQQLAQIEGKIYTMIHPSCSLTMLRQKAVEIVQTFLLKPLFNKQTADSLKPSIKPLRMSCERGSNVPSEDLRSLRRQSLKIMLQLCM